MEIDTFIGIKSFTHMPHLFCVCHSISQANDGSAVIRWARDLEAEPGVQGGVTREELLCGRGKNP